MNAMKLRVKTFFLEIEYDGTDFCGWQLQRKKRVATVQGELNRALRKLFRKNIITFGSGRTDTGVHARMFGVHFRAETKIAPGSIKKALNTYLCKSVRVRNVRAAREGFHARYSCTSKVYRYVIRNASCDDVFMRRYAWWIKEALDVSLMKKAAQRLVGKKDFSSFANERSTYNNCVRTIKNIVISEKKGCIIIDIEADGFLRRMVRNIVSFLVDIGKARYSLSGVDSVLLKKDRACIGSPAPARGLFLWKVKYPGKYFLKRA